MPIVSSEVLKIYPSMPSGARVVKERHIFNSGYVWNHRYITTLDNSELDAQLIVHAARHDTLDKDTEVLSTTSGLKKGLISSDVLAQSEDQSIFDRRILFEYMTIFDIDDFRTGLDFFDAVSVRGGANANQRASYLGVSSVIWDQIDSRFNDLRGVLFFVDDRKNHVWGSVKQGIE